MPLWMPSTRIFNSTEAPFLSTATPIVEGCGLEYTSQVGVNPISPGTSALQPGSGNSGAVFGGISWNYVQVPTNGQWVDTAVVPGSSPYTYQLSQVPLNYNTDVGIVDSTGALWTNTGGSAPASTKHYSVSSTGLVTFYSANVGLTVTVFYMYALTVTQAQDLYGSNYSYVGNVQATQVIGSIGVIKQSPALYTDQYDPGVNWLAPGINNITLAANGIFTRGGSGAAVSGTVIQAPDSTSFPSPYLGISFNTLV